MSNFKLFKLISFLVYFFLVAIQEYPLQSYRNDSEQGYRSTVELYDESKHSQ